METFAHISQIYTAVAIFVVWVLRHDIVENEFKQFGYSNILRDFVGASKISISTCLIVGIWHPDIVFFSAVIMVFLMAAAQYSHFKVRNPFYKFLPSLILLILNVFIAYNAHIQANKNLIDYLQ